MTAPRSAASRHACPEPCRRDGWTLDRQAAFLVALAETRSVSRAAAAAGMSREGAYRLKRRPVGASFAAAWDRLLASGGKGHSKGHKVRAQTGGATRVRAGEGDKGHNTREPRDTGNRVKRTGWSGRA